MSICGRILSIIRAQKKKRGLPTPGSCGVLFTLASKFLPSLQCEWLADYSGIIMLSIHAAQHSGRYLCYRTRDVLSSSYSSDICAAAAATYYTTAFAATAITVTFASASATTLSAPASASALSA